MDTEKTYISGEERAVETAETYFDRIASRYPWARRLINERPKILEKLTCPVPLYAVVNCAKWIVECPTCHNAEFFWEDGMFWCSDCHNDKADGALRPVIMPDERVWIEELLGKRELECRNWTPGETMDNLVKENLRYLHKMEVN